MATIRGLKLLFFLGIIMFFVSKGSVSYAQTNTSPFPADGNVGIGTTNPSADLHVKGSGVLLRLNDTGSLGTEFNVTGGNISIMNQQTGYLALGTTGSERMRITSGGNVGIGTTNPALKLHVAGNAVINGNIGIGTTSPSGRLHVKGSGVLLRLNDTGSLGTEFNVTGANTTIMNQQTGYLALGTTGSERMRITSGGNIGIGTTSPTSNLHVVGNVRITGDLTTDGNIAAKYQDVAEWVPTPISLPAGTVVIIDPVEVNGVIQASDPYDTRVAGVVSAQPGILLGEPGDNKVKVAHSGRVKAKADAQYGPIEAGDLLVASATPGYVMRSKPVDFNGIPMHRPGTIIGKALEPLKEGRGEILVLLTLQ